jgi:hypothetical protein
MEGSLPILLVAGQKRQADYGGKTNGTPPKVTRRTLHVSHTVKVLASDQPAGPEANQELFLFHREADGQWRIARYIFSTTNPPKRA